MSRITESLYRVSGIELTENKDFESSKDKINDLMKEREELMSELEYMGRGSFDHAPDPSAWDIIRHDEIRKRLKEISKKLDKYKNS